MMVARSLFGATCGTRGLGVESQLSFGRVQGWAWNGFCSAPPLQAAWGLEPSVSPTLASGPPSIPPTRPQALGSAIPKSQSPFRPSPRLC